MNTKITLTLLLVLISVTLSNVNNSTDAAETGYELEGVQTAEKIPTDINMYSLARLPQVSRQGLDVIGRGAFDTYVSPGTGYETGLRGPIGMWMHNPVLAEAMFDVRQRVRYETEKDQRLTELITISTAREINNQYEYSAHEPLAQSAGLEQGIIDIVRFRRPLENLPPTDGFGEIEHTLIQFTRELISEEKVSSQTFAKAIELFGNQGVMDITGLIGYYNFVAMTLKAFDVQRPAGSELLLPIRDGTL